jgi:GR25 family glycosyltransferase involved in LPS biosynthesis
MINKIIAILFLVLILSFFIIYFKYLDDDINQIYVINLKKRPERLEQFKKNYKLNCNVKIVNAIDGNELNNIDTLVGKVGKQSLDNFYKHKIPRKFHYELSSYGAIGCYLSHINVWKDIIEKNNNIALIFEDDANASNIKYNNIIKRLKLLPEDWDIYLMINPDFCYKRIKVENKLNLYKVKRFFLLHSYIININACKKIIENGNLFPINQQIDHHLSELAMINKLNIYVHNKLSYFNTITYKSDIQINTASSLSYERFELI